MRPWIWPVLLILLAGLIVLFRLLAPDAPRKTPEAPREPPLPPSEQVRKFAREGRKIDAIKLYRKETGLGLKEAKDAVDRLE